MSNLLKEEQTNLQQLTRAMQDAPQEEQQGATEVPRYIKGESEASKQLYEFVSLVEMCIRDSCSSSRMRLSNTSV